MRDEDWIISLTAFIAFAAYIGGCVKGRNTPRSFFFNASNIWMIGFTVFVMHFISAFHYKYEWSHVKALEFTAKQTFEITGVETSIGLYFNYFFTLTWLCDLLWLKLANQSYENRPRWLSHTIHGFMAFMWFNATVIFGSPIGQLIGGIAFLGLGILWVNWQKIMGHSVR